LISSNDKWTSLAEQSCQNRYAKTLSESNFAKQDETTDITRDNVSMPEINQTEKPLVHGEGSTCKYNDKCQDQYTLTMSKAKNATQSEAFDPLAENNMISETSATKKTVISGMASFSQLCRFNTSEMQIHKNIPLISIPFELTLSTGHDKQPCRDQYTITFSKTHVKQNQASDICKVKEKISETSRTSKTLVSCVDPFSHCGISEKSIS